MSEMTDGEALKLIKPERLAAFERMREGLDEFVAEIEGGDNVVDALAFVFRVTKEVARGMTETAWSVRNSYLENEEILLKLGVSSEAISLLLGLGKELGRKMVDTSLKKVGRGDEDPIFIKMAIDLARAKRDLPLADQEGYRSLGRKQFERAVAWDLKGLGVKLTEGSRYSQSPVSFEHQQQIWKELLGITQVNE